MATTPDEAAKAEAIGRIMLTLPAFDAVSLADLATRLEARVREVSPKPESRDLFRLADAPTPRESPVPS